MRSLKKNLAKKIQSNPDAELLFFDEARFGTHSKLGHAWYPKGSRTQVKVKLGFKSFYTYSATNHLSGKHFSLIMPKVNTECMNVYLHELSINLKDKKALLVVDGAGWHKSKRIIVPWNIEIIYLPPYSPELNPVERLWNYIKYHTIRNKIYSSLCELEDKVCQFINNITTENIASICSVNYLSTYI